MTSEQSTQKYQEAKHGVRLGKADVHYQLSAMTSAQYKGWM